jgi:GMP synthase PP-ATPase subunit
MSTAPRIYRPHPRISNLIINETCRINRAVLAISSKSPATVE